MSSIARALLEMGFEICATPGTKRFLEVAAFEGIIEVPKIQSGQSPNVLDYMAERRVTLVINTATGRGRQYDEARIRERTIALNIPCITTIPAARAAISGIRALKSNEFLVHAVQDYFPS